MNPAEHHKVGILACSGPEHPGSSLADTAARLVITELLPDTSEYVELSSFVADENKRNQILSSDLLVSVEGCSTSCCQSAVEKYDKPFELIIVKDLLDRWNEPLPDKDGTSRDNFTSLAMRIAGEIVMHVDNTVRKKDQPAKLNEKVKLASVSPEKYQVVEAPGTTTIEVKGRKVQVLDYEKIFNFMVNYTDLSDDIKKNKIVKLYKIYNRPVHEIPDKDLADVLFREYQQYLEKNKTLETEEQEGNLE